MVNPEKNLNPAKGIFLIIIAFLGFSIMSAFIKVCSVVGLKTQEIMFFQNLIALIVIASVNILTIHHTKHKIPMHYR